MPLAGMRLTIGSIKRHEKLGADKQNSVNLNCSAFLAELGRTQTPIQWKPGALSLAIKQPGCEFDHSPPPSAEVKECVEIYLHSPNTPSWRGAQLKHRDDFPFTFFLAQIARSKRMSLWFIHMLECYVRIRGKISLNVGV
jgi:hypothetical protein